MNLPADTLHIMHALIQSALVSLPPAVPPIVLLLSIASSFGARTKVAQKRTTTSYRRLAALLLLPTLPVALVSFVQDFRFRCRHAWPSSPTAQYPSDEYALVTGASSGIGRDIAMALANNGVPLILVARDKRQRDHANKPDELERVAESIRSEHDVSVITMRADFAQPGQARRLHEKTTSANLTVAQIVLAAGYGPTNKHILLGDDIEKTIRINVESTAILASLYGKDLAALVTRRQEIAASSFAGSLPGKAVLPPHILIVSSVLGTAVGQPDAALYAATKAFGRSLGQSLAIELKPLGISVTTLCPGATDTSFAPNSGMEKAGVWNFPLGTVSSSKDVAKRAVQMMKIGGGIAMPGLMNYLTFRVIMPLMPDHFVLKFNQFCWNPWPFAFPPGWRQSYPGVMKASNEL